MKMTWSSPSSGLLANGDPFILETSVTDRCRKEDRNGEDERKCFE